ncbi:MAG TPA: hypothetical protein DD435_06925 [Cyanobacteria bacterium UBA8530]|nr:hypothetical protein [Cyanobacteria bacterium UBA8530]
MLKIKKKFGIDELVNLTSILAILFLAAAVVLPHVRAFRYFALIPWLRGIGLGGLFVFLILQAWIHRKKVSELFGHRRARSGANSALQIVLFLGLLVVLNSIAAGHRGRLDLTSGRDFSLAEQTKKIVKNLKTDVLVTSYFKETNPSSMRARELWKEYSYLSPRLKYRQVDPDKDRARAIQAGVKRYGVSVIEAEGRKVEIEGTSEGEFTGGIIKATRGEQKVVLFLEGHGEASPNSQDQENGGGLSTAKEAIEKQNYRVEPLSLIAHPQVPASASLLVVAGPKKALLKEEVSAIASFVERGGKVLLLLSPQVKTGLEQWLKSYGITPDDNLVLDYKQHYFVDASAPLINRYPFHSITQNLPDSFFPAARSLSADRKMPEGVSAAPLLETSDSSWGETNLLSRNLEYNEGQDKKGPLTLAYAVDVEKKEKRQKTRLVLFGNARFASDGAFTAVGNGDLFLASLNWLAEDEDLIAIPPKPPGPQPLVFSNGQMMQVFYAVMSLPAFLLFFGGLVWWKRRRS